MYRIGIDLGGSYIKTGITDEEYNLVTDSVMKTDLKKGPDRIVEEMLYEVKNLLLENDVSESEVIGIGISSPGIIDKETGAVIYSNNFDWDGYPLRENMQRLSGMNVTVKNDALCAVMGELKKGAARGLENVVMLTLGTGVGGGIVCDGKVFEGGGSGSVAGHIIVQRNGRLCTCGRRGCLEAYASATALINETRKVFKEHSESLVTLLCEGDPEKINGKTAFEAARAGDKYGRIIVQDYIDALSQGIADLINLFRPEVVLLGGGISNEGEKLLKPVNEKVKELCYGKEKVRIAPVMRATLGNGAGIIGAAALTE